MEAATWLFHQGPWLVAGVAVGGVVLAALLPWLWAWRHHRRDVGTKRRALGAAAAEVVGAVGETVTVLGTLRVVEAPTRRAADGAPAQLGYKGPEVVMSDDAVFYELVGAVAVVRMDDGKANALSHALIDRLLAALDQAEREAAAVLLTGRPGKLCAGFDLRTMMSGIDAARALVTHGAEMYLRLYEFPAPVVLACTGHAMAGGAVLLLTADTRIGVEGPFKIGLTEIAIGMPLPLFVQELARDRIAAAHRVAATLQATIYDPQAAVDVGYLDRVVAPDDLASEALKVATALAGLPTEPYGLTKQRMRASTTERVRATLAEDMARLTPPTG